MGALWIAHADVLDEEKYAEYAKPAARILEEHGGVILARGARFVQFEGKQRGRQVIVRFPSIEAAQACYDDPRYQALAKIAHENAEREVLVVETSD